MAAGTVSLAVGLMFEFSWRALVFTLLCLAFGLYVYGQDIPTVPTFTITTGVVTANDIEIDGCYFAVGQHAMLIFRPGSTPCQIVQQELLGRSIKLQAVVESIR